jgi:hypothetical protein
MLYRLQCATVAPWFIADAVSHLWSLLDPPSFCVTIVQRPYSQHKVMSSLVVAPPSRLETKA